MHLLLLRQVAVVLLLDVADDGVPAEGRGESECGKDREGRRRRRNTKESKGIHRKKKEEEEEDVEKAKGNANVKEEGETMKYAYKRLHKTQQQKFPKFNQSISTTASHKAPE
ncbi:hypothetical protein E2C01_055434 [Portunus trituberculatus]|uniref:Uncharacterized protein n=1 Tax=Portunus trituberculatus TaxID=210409 RepID=A0A5B7GXQ4_PORTR|nr:hypothetical protein [Portunus trituberculatus]